MKYVLSAEERLRYLGFDDRWLMIIGFPAVVALTYVFFADPSGTGGNRATVLSCLVMGGGYTLIYWGALRILMIELRARFRREEDTLKRVLLQLGGLLVLILFVLLFVDPLLLSLLPVEEAGLVDQPLLFTVAVSFVLCSMMIGIYEAIFFFTKYRQSRIEQERLARAGIQSQLSALKQQVNPHFLFNSLNTLATLIPEDPRVATRFVQRLSAVYRRLLEYRHEDLIPLEEELAALEDYLFLLRTRFEDKLRVEIDPSVTDSVAAARGATGGARHLLPPLTLQLLVENAIKHNVVSHDRPLTIRIAVEDRYVTVTNNLQRRPGETGGTGVGQHNIVQRYRLLSDQPVRVETAGDRYRVAIPLLPANTPLRYAP